MYLAANRTRSFSSTHDQEASFCGGLELPIASDI